MNEITCNITKNTKVLIKANAPEVNLKEPLYAINWFSTKMEWMYHFYNFLASKSVVKIGAEAFFKGKVTKTILDEKGSARELILIIKYPDGNSFKALMENTYFKLVSVFRMLSVKNFSFGFTQKETISNSDLNDGLTYVIHHFKTSEINASFFNQFESLLNANVTIKYAGKMVANLVTKSKGKEDEEIPNIIDGLVIFEAKNESDILNLIDSPAYKSLIKILESSFIGTLNRIL